MNYTGKIYWRLMVTTLGYLSANVFRCVVLIQTLKQYPAKS